METWKVLLWLAFMMVSFAIFAEITNITLSSSGDLLIVLFFLILVALSYVGSKKGYQIGRQMGEQKQNDD